MSKKKRAETKKEISSERQSEVVRPFEEPLKKHLIPILILLIITAGIYFNSLFNGFVYDDTITIINNLFIRDWKNIEELFSKYYFSRSGEATYRPIVTLSYFVDYSLWGLKPFGYHLTNILIHSGNVVLVYLFTLSLFRDRGVAFLSALLFDVHPVQAEAVNAISFREDLLVIFFLLPSFILFIRLFEDFGSGYIRRLFYLASLALYAIALFSKEMAITYPLLLIGYIYLTTSPSPPSEEGKGGFKGGNIRRGYHLYLISGYMVVTLIYLLIYYGPLRNINPGEFPYAIPDLPTRLLTLLTVIVRYFLLFIFPYSLNADYVIDFNRSLTEPSLLLNLIILSGIIVAAIYLARKSTLHLCKGMGVEIGLFWFFISLLPVMNIVPIEHIMAERYLYLPLIGLSLFASICLMTIYKGLPDGIKMAGVSAVVVITMLLSIRTVYRNMDWKDDMTFYSKTVVVSPNSFMAHNNLGMAYKRQGNLDAAIKEYETAIKLRPDYSSDAHYNLGNAYMSQGNLGAAIEEYKIAIKLRPDYSDAHNNLGNAYDSQGNLGAAIEEYKIAIKLRPNADTHYNLGNAYDSQGNLDAAIKEYETAIKLRPDHSLSHNNLGMAYKRQGRWQEAVTEYQSAIVIDPKNYRFYSNLGNAYMSLGRADEAINAYRTSLSLKPDSPDTHYNLGLVYFQHGSYQEAFSEWSIVLSIAPDHVSAKEGLEIIRRRTEQSR